MKVWKKSFPSIITHLSLFNIVDWKGDIQWITVGTEWNVSLKESGIEQVYHWNLFESKDVYEGNSDLRY